MLTPEQEKWISHLRDDDKIEIHPYDPRAIGIFEKIKKQIQSRLGPNIDVEHRGSTSLGISGQGELDIYIPVATESFELLLGPLEDLFGKPGSVYLKKRARFVSYLEGAKEEIFLINRESGDWTRCLRFENHLKNNSDYLRAYEDLKSSSAGLSTREYYRRKNEFINGILGEPD